MTTTDFNRLSKELSGKGGIFGSLLLFIIIVLIISLIVWANFTELDNVTRGNGRVISALENQTVQASDSGVIQARYVEKGQIVGKSDLLFEIDPIESKTELERAMQKLASLKIQSVRLFAEISNEELFFSNELIALAPTVVASEKSLYLARRADLVAQLAVLEQQLAQRNQQVEEINVQTNTALETLALIEDQIKIMAPMVKAGLSPETDLLSLKRQARDFKGKENSAEASLIRTQSSIYEVQDKIKAAKQNYKTKSQGELTSIISLIAEVESQLPALNDRVNRTQIRSPVDGIVNQIQFVTLGGFIRPGDALLTLVPLGDDLIVEANIDPKDIAYIEPNQKARISLTAYDASRYGTIDGKIIQVSPDAVQDQATGGFSYIIQVSLDNVLYEDDNSEVEVIPGMVASVDVLAGKRTVLEYFWRPMVKVKERAFRD
jgi:adhesin transport system membrane fusion protein